MIEFVEQILSHDADDKQASDNLAQQLVAMSGAEQVACLKGLAAESEGRLLARQDLLESVLRRVVRPILAGPLPPEEGSQLGQEWRRACSDLYRRLPAHSGCRYWLLLLLNRDDSPDALGTLAELLASDPPSDSDVVAAVVARLLQSPPSDPTPLFPKLLDGLQHPSVAVPILDLANYYCRQQVLPEHPAASRHSQLAALLGQLVHRMQGLEERGGEAPQADVVKKIDETVALAIGLCDALGQIGEQEHTGKLIQAMDLKHRRIRIVAAAALAAMGVESGRDVVLEMAAEPVVRRYAVETANSLGFADKLDAQHQTPYAIAESQLASWLAQPTQFGIPPTRMELLDSRTLYWPGFDEPQDLFLIRFEYQIGEGEFSNVGLSGARVNACAADLSEFTNDDVFAVFAGMDIDHEDVFEIPLDQWSRGHQEEAARLMTRLQTSGYEDIQPHLLCFFLGSPSLAVTARKDGRQAVAIAAADEVLSRSMGLPPRQLRPEHAAALYRGRKILHTFNQDSPEEAEQHRDGGDNQ